MTKSILEEARGLIERPENWTSYGKYWSDEKHGPWSLRGAVRDCADGSHYAFSKAMGVIHSVLVGPPLTTKFEQQAKHSEVLRLLDEAIEKEKNNEMGY